MTDQLPQKPELGEWLENALDLPFRLPRIPFAQTAKNLDKAVATLVAAGGENLAARVKASTARIEARSEAERTLIEYGAKQIDNADPAFAERARDHAIGDILRSQANREEVLRHASEELAEKSPTSDAKQELDEDWLNAFSKYAEQKSKADVQKVWGKILAAEIRSPGATSLRTLQFLSTVDSAEATMITSAFCYVLNGLVIPKKVDEMKLIPYVSLMRLQELNVITGLYGIGGHSMKLTSNVMGPLGRVITISYFKATAMFQGPAEGEFSTDVDVLALTEIGKQLFAISETLAPDYRFFRDISLAIKPANTRRIQIIGPDPGPAEVIFDQPT
jgi:hypothetical protein